MMKRLWQWTTAIAAAGFLAACGGGGSGGDPLFGGGGGGGAPTASDITLQLSSTSVTNSGSDAVTVTVTAVDAGRNALAGIPVSISVDNDAVAAVGGSATNDAGQLAATITIGANRSNRLITVRARSGSLERVAAFQVTGARLTGSAVPAVVLPGSTNNAIQYRLVDVNENPMPGLAIAVSAPGVAEITGTTDGNGSFEYVYTAPTTPGTIAFTATAGGAVPAITTVLVQSGPGAIPDAVGPVLSASVSADPSVVRVNSSTTDNRAELRTLFLGADNAPIPNMRVRFRLPDPNSIGGTITTGTSLVYSDANGVATSAYRPGTRSSPTDGVVIQACYSTTDFAEGACPTSVMTTLTVVSEALAVSVGTNNEIDEGAGGLTYIKRYVVLVVDSSGQARADVQLTASVDLLAYLKGYYDGPENWNRLAPSGANPVPISGVIGFTGPTCPNEDENRNGSLEVGEDINLNGQLDPRRSDVVISYVGSSRTNASGIAIIQLEYPKTSATWIDFSILVSAAGVVGTEGRATFEGRLPAAAAEFEATPPPSFVVSPYGIGNFDTNMDGTIDCEDSD